ncbi:MAG: PAS domain-containing protein, partial [Myxococcota bacterium]
MSAENAMKGRINSKIRKRVSEIVDNLVVAGAELGTLRVKEKVLEKSVISTAICDSMGVVIYANPSCLKLLGFSDQSLMVGRKAMDFWEEQLKAGEVIKTARREGSWVGELTARRKDGSLLPVQIAVQVLEDSSGQPQYFMGTFRDISDRIRMEDALRESEARYQALFYRSMECLYIHDFSGNFLDANDASLTLLGYTRDELPGINFSKLLSADQIPKAMACIQELLETG